ncbi:MAG: spore germination protein, partial [Oscillospiraceae bacterium]
MVNNYDKIITAVLSGTTALIIEGYSQAVMIDARTYPARSVSEPDDDKVLRGSRDGFVETLVFNTALIRRRIRDPNLTMQIMQIGKKSKTDIVVCYMEDAVDKKILTAFIKRLKEITINTLTMSQESLAECLIKKQWYNPFP